MSRILPSELCDVVLEAIQLNGRMDMTDLHMDLHSTWDEIDEAVKKLIDLGDLVKGEDGYIHLPDNGR